MNGAMRGLLAAGLRMPWVVVSLCRGWARALLHPGRVAALGRGLVTSF